MYIQRMALVGRTAHARAAAHRDLRRFVFHVDPVTSQGKKLKATVVKEVSSEFDIDRESDIPWNSDVREKKV